MANWKWLIMLMLSPSAIASNKIYSADLTNSVWQVTKANPIECTLDHNIPRFGNARFTVRASKSVNIDFDLDGKRETPATRQVTLRSVPPSWRPGVAANDITLVKFHEGFDGYLSGKNAWAMLSELEEGQFPTFIFSDWYNQDEVTQVALSAVNFRQKYLDFNDCVSGLLPYSFEDISFSILNYVKNGSDLTRHSKQRLKMIGEYLRYDEAVNIILIDGYSDSYGGRWSNQQLSEKRAESVKSYLTELGVDPSKFTVEGHGEKRHIADNRSDVQRPKNRRVVISIGREEEI
ncbi:MULTISPECIES: OmpA family protein [unclassified Motilimonas]|uniref:flagellar protein MotY n=1 Tax=Motilimonas TaxID=1914248 RepID=UPI001E4B0EFA|nr:MULTISPECIES: OmpA family protein [unclassified Motilimonas]MCE0557577.1 OmpA family protein [Motilimonas sp. E26]MDO6526254.1 OmpA family protein [Motilimonas sp. 1_MG-2023]